MDQESLAQIRQIVTEATQGLRQEIIASADEAKRHTGVLFEDRQHKFELVIEGQHLPSI